ncbi:MAG: NusG domain II-containing protein [Clostridia bacterium]|nr:NusG domain II-containing protein [Clostridia bacterium]
MKTFEDAEKSPFFRKGDIFLYLVLVLVIVGLFCFGFATKEEGELENLLVYRDDTLVFSYSFAEDKYNAYEEVKVEETKEGYLVTIYTEGEYNLFCIEKRGYVKMLDADCSVHRDCVAMWAITDRSGVIICTPHHLKLCASDEILDPSIG